jgi:drug/metabolite transporter (DMT)-like permease
MILPPLLYFIWSLAFPIGKKLVEFSPPLFLTGSRMVLGGGFLFLYMTLFQRKSFKKIPFIGWIALSLLAFFSIFLTNILEFWSLQYLSSAKTCFLYSFSPFLTAVLSYIHFNEKMTLKKGLGISVGTLGFFPVLIAEDKGSFVSLFSISLPELAMFGAVFFAVYGWILLRILVKDNQISPPLANAISMGLGGIISIIASLFIDSWSPIPIKEGSRFTFTALLFLLTFISNGICYNLYGYLLKKYTATFLSFFGLLSPIFTSIHGFLILNEPISPTILLSTAIVFLGLFLVYSEDTKLGYIQKNSTEPSVQSDNPQRV